MNRSKACGWFAAGLGCGVALAAIGVICGRGRSDRQMAIFPQSLLEASTASTRGPFAMATGAMDEDTEGLFILDFETGELHCAIMSPRVGRFNGLYRTNVLGDLAVDRTQEPQFVMVTGEVNFLRGSAPTSQPSLAACYVLDANTGNYVAYAVPWQREASRANQPQAGGLVRLDAGTVRFGPLARQAKPADKGADAAAQPPAAAPAPPKKP